MPSRFTVEISMCLLHELCPKLWLTRAHRQDNVEVARTYESVARVYVLCGSFSLVYPSNTLPKTAPDCTSQRAMLEIAHHNALSKSVGCRQTET